MSENKKYELTEEYTECCGKKLYRIRALRNFSNVKKGELGGFLESEKNLSRTGKAWVGSNARVYGNARVEGNARVDGDVVVNDNARVYGNAYVHGNVVIDGFAWINGNAKIERNEDYACVKGFGVACRNTTFFRCEDGQVRVTCGCFFGTIPEFREQVKRTRTGKIAKEYLMIADLMEYHYVTDESIDDTLMDLANYCIMELVERSEH